MSDAEQLLRSLLDTIATENDYKDCEIKLQSFSTGGANYTSQLHHITLSAPGKDDLKLFAKSAIVNENIRAQLEIFETEIFFYSELLKMFQEMENEHKIPTEHRLATAKFYGCNREYLKEILVLEDLSAQGFNTHDRLKSYDWKYASKSVTELSKLHALSIAYNKEYPEKFDALYAKLRKDMDNFKSIMQGIIDMSVTVMRKENKAKVVAFLQKVQIDEFYKFLMTSRRPIIAHGDYRSSNLMHRRREIQSYGLLVSLLLLPIVTVEAENAPKIDGDSNIREMIKPNELAATRLNGVINDFVKLDVL